MMTILDDVASLLVRQAKNALCDDCIAEKLKIHPRQHANHKTRELAQRKQYVRRKDVCSSCRAEKLVISVA